MIYSHQNLIEFAELTTRAKRPLHNNHHVWKWEGEMKEEKYFPFVIYLPDISILLKGKLLHKDPILQFISITF